MSEKISETEMNSEAETNENGENEIDLDEMVEQAQEFHTMIDQMKGWSRRNMEALLKEYPDADDPEIERYDQAYDLIRSVEDRIESGDLTRSRRP